MNTVKPSMCEKIIKNLNFSTLYSINFVSVAKIRENIILTRVMMSPLTVLSQTAEYPPPELCFMILLPSMVIVAC